MAGIKKNWGEISNEKESGLYARRRKPRECEEKTLPGILVTGGDEERERDMPGTITQRTVLNALQTFKTHTV